MGHLLFQDELVELPLREAAKVLRAQEKEGEAHRDPSGERDPGRTGHERRHAGHGEEHNEAERRDRPRQGERRFLPRLFRRR